MAAVSPSSGHWRGTSPTPPANAAGPTTDSEAIHEPLTDGASVPEHAMNAILVIALVCGVFALALNLLAIACLVRRRATGADTTLRFVPDPLDDTVPATLVSRHRAPVEVTARG